MDSRTKNSIIGEMKNDAMFLDLLKRNGYKNAPKLFYSGYYRGKLLYINIVELILGNYISI